MSLVRKAFGFSVAALACAHAHIVLSQTTLEVPANTPLAVTEFISDGFLNLRSSADVSSAILKKLSVGQTGLSATGRTTLIGDTPWVEITDGTDTGWVNSRFVRRADSSSPLTAPDTKAALDRKANHEFEGRGYSENTVKSYAQCEQLCLANDRCAAVEFHRDTRLCNLFERELKMIAARTIDVGIKTHANGQPSASAKHVETVAARTQTNVGQPGAATLKKVKQDVCEGTVKESVSTLPASSQTRVEGLLRAACERCFSEGLAAQLSNEQRHALDAAFAGKVDGTIDPEITKEAHSKYDLLFAECSAALLAGVDAAVNARN